MPVAAADPTECPKRRLRERHRPGSLVASPAAVCAMVLLIGGCAAPRETTRLAGGDLSEAISQAAEAIRGSAWLAGRSPDSPEAVVVIQEVENLTSDLIPPSEQWMIMARLRSALDEPSVREQRNVVFQVAPQRWSDARAGGFEGDLGGRSAPTHVMSATFRSATRLGEQGRSELTDLRSETYLLAFRITRLDTRERVFSAAVDVKRAASGRLID
jgi:hypothetical protein